LKEKGHQKEPSIPGRRFFKKEAKENQIGPSTGTILTKKEKKQGRSDHPARELSLSQKPRGG